MNRLVERIVRKIQIEADETCSDQAHRVAIAIVSIHVLVYVVMAVFLGTIGLEWLLGTWLVCAGFPTVITLATTRYHLRSYRRLRENRRFL
jgi:hypothetical protein